MALTVWVDAWQMQCCGKPFSVGSSVEWTLGEPELEWLSAVLDAAAPDFVEAAEDHHGRLPVNALPTRGLVTGIQAVHCRFEAAPGGKPTTFHPVAGSGVRTDLKRADGWTPDRGDLRFTGYLVDLELLPEQASS